MPERSSSATARLLAGSESPARARRLVAELGGGLPDELIQDALVATSELVTNAVRHAGGVLTISVERGPDALAVAVADLSSAPPVPLEPGTALRGSGHGLRLVDRLTDAWGSRPTADGAGKVVWFRISAHGGGSP